MPTGDLPDFEDLVVSAHRPRLFHQYPRILPNGTVIEPTQFNPHTKARFSGLTADPPRAMFYAGDTRGCAMWECPPLRDLIGPVATLSRRQFTHLRLVELALQRDLQLVDLDIKTVRRMVKSIADIDLLEALKVAPEHSRTHAAAAALLALATERSIALDGLTWRSKQHGTGAVYLLYGPPATSDVFSVVPDSEIALDDPAQGWPVIDEALALAGMRRLTADDDIGDALAAAPP